MKLNLGDPMYLIALVKALIKKLEGLICFVVSSGGPGLNKKLELCSG